MKILILLADANLKGGTEMLAFRLLEILNARNPKSAAILSVAPYKGSCPDVISFDAAAYSRFRRIEAFPLNKIAGSVFSDALLSRMIARKAKETAAQWVVAHDYDLISALPYRLARCAQVFNWSVKGYEDGMLRSLRSRLTPKNVVSLVRFLLQRWRWHRALQRLEKLIVLSESAKAELLGMLPSLQRERLCVISNPLPYDGPARNLSSLENKVVVFVGRLSPEKGGMRLLRIWKRLQEMLPDYTLAIYGKGHLKGEMESYIAANRLERVVFKGFSDNLEQIYTQADLLLMTSDTEGFGMVLIEAMYYGVPCVSFDCPVSPKEIIGDAGVTVPCFDEEEYANAVVNLLHDRLGMQKRQSIAVKRARRFYIGSVVEKWRGLMYAD